MPDVFISYKREDREKAEALARAISAHGYNVWWDTKLLAGDGYRSEILEALASARAAIVMWSKLSVDSSFVVDEASRARDRGILLPVRIDNCDIPLGFGQLHTLDLIAWNGKANASALKDLLTAVERRAPRGVAGAADASGEPLEGKSHSPSPKKRLNVRILLGLAAALVLGAIIWLAAGEKHELAPAEIAAEAASATPAEAVPAEAPKY